MPRFSCLKGAPTKQFDCKLVSNAPAPRFDFFWQTEKLGHYLKLYS